MPLHRMTVDDGERTEIYVAERSGEVVMKTSASGRRWGYLGAVMHWLYFTPLRRKSALWSNTIIWVSIAGTIMAFVGFVWGSWRISPFRGYRLGHKPRLRADQHHLDFQRSPLDGSVGLEPEHAADARTARSRLPRTAPSRQRAAASASEGLAVFGVDTPKEIDLIRFRGHHYLRASTGLVAVDTVAQGPDEAFHADDMLGAAQDAMPGVPIEGVYWMSEYDPCYYDRSGRLNLPVLRVRFGDSERTWLYLDPKLGAIVRKGGA